MTWTLIRSWAKTHGYECKKVSDGYSWKIGETTNVSKSVRKLAYDIFNHMTNNKFVEYQQSYENL
jgi:hypothetical protein